MKAMNAMNTLTTLNTPAADAVGKGNAMGRMKLVMAAAIAAVAVQLLCVHAADAATDEVAPKPPRRHRKAAARSHRPPLFAELHPAEDLRRRVYLALMEEQRLLRHIERTRCRELHGTDDFVQRITTPSYAAATPDVSVIVTLYNYAGVVVETLDSIVASTGVDFEDAHVVGECNRWATHSRRGARIPTSVTCKTYVRGKGAASGARPLHGCCAAPWHHARTIPPFDLIAARAPGSRRATRAAC